MDESIRKQAKAIVSRLTDMEKANLAVGLDYWNIRGLKEYGLDSIRQSDGPHGLRIQIGEADYTGLQPSLATVCYPPAVLAACSFDPDLLEKYGTALGKECVQNEVAILLGPGINHKRSPFGGRNFEYYSEDPYLTGKLASAMVKGIQKTGTVSCLKHFVANSQENYRMTSDSRMDKRTLEEIYLKNFKTVVKEANPKAMMTAYNLINNCYCSENKELLDECRSWGFDGSFITDWGGLNDPILSFKNGTDLEMPGLSKGSEMLILENVSHERLDEIAEHLVTLLLLGKNQKEEKFSITPQEQEQIALEVAQESAILLKNKNHLLPLHKSQSIALIGDLAKHPRYQGSGSSKVNSRRVETLYNVFEKEEVNFVFAQGYQEGGSSSSNMIKRAVNALSICDVGVVILGLPEIYEAEGYDRTDLSLPQGQLDLMKELTKTDKPLVVILECGSVVKLPFERDVDSILLMYLGGDFQDQAAYDLMFGRKNPSGKLAETWVLDESDVPIERQGHIVDYKEGIFSGYRYYNTLNRAVQYPFGYGLSYTDFEYKNLKAKLEDNLIKVSLEIKNAGKVKGKEVVQVYIHKQSLGVERPVQELKAFKKVELESGESKKIELSIPLEELKYFSMKQNDWYLENGTYEIQVGSSSRDIREKTDIKVETGTNPEYIVNSVNILEEAVSRSNDEFEKTIELHSYGKKQGKYDQNSTIEDIINENRLYGWFLKKQLNKYLANEPNPTSRKIMEETTMQMPVRLLGMYGLNKTQIKGIIDILNAHYIRGIRNLLHKA